MSDLPKLIPPGDHLYTGLCCAALNRELGSVLIFDLQPDQAGDIAHTFAQMLKAVSGQTVTRVVLRSEESEDSLWGSFGLNSHDPSTPLIWQPGLLAPTNQEEIRLVVIPELERVNSIIARALVAMVGAETVSVERYGRQQHWRPNFYWLAGCAGSATGRISLHLMDRFALRLQARKHTTRGASDLLERLARADQSTADVQPSLEEALVRRLRIAAAAWPDVSGAAISRVVEYDADPGNSSPRRGFALTRLAHTLARWAGGTEVGGAHIDQAARLIGVPAPRDRSVEKTSTNRTAAAAEVTEARQEKEVSPAATSAAVPPAPSSLEQQSETLEQIVAATPAEALAPAPLRADLDPYREDKQPPEREAASLRLPFQRSRQISTTRGIIVGTQPATTLHDLAMAATLFEAAKFQHVRRRSLRRSPRRDLTRGGLLIGPSDLRGYRRTPQPEQLLIVLLDYTCLQGRRWLETLLAYFKDAYIHRASVCLIQVGAASAAHLLRAEKQSFNSVLVPALGAALDTASGKATPLAHGLDLALHTVRHALQHGRQIAHSAQLVVISDGRGNVPLIASITGRIDPPVGREGIDDALRAAHRLRAMDRLMISLLDPQPSSHAGFVTELAEALGATLQAIPLLDSVLAREEA